MRKNLPIEEIKNLYEKGFSSRQIAKMYNCDKTTILMRLKEAGIKLRHVKKKMSLPLEKIRELYEQGLGVETIAKIMGCSDSVIRDRLKEIGVMLRPNSAPLKIIKNTIEKEITPIELAYIAGFFDGEGYIKIGIYGKRIEIRVGITSTKIEILNWIKNKINLDFKIKAKKRKKPTHKEAYDLTLTKIMEIKAFLEAISPYLKIKREIVKLTLLLIERKINRYFHGENGWTPEDFSFAEKIKELNKRGK